MNTLNFEYLNYSVGAEELKSAFEEVRTKGFYIFPKIFNEKICQEIISEIDILSKQVDVEVNYGGSEHRIWNSQSKSNIIKKFEIFSNLLISSFLNKNKKAFDILAYRNLPIKEGELDLINDRWHLDSLNNQYKVFLFLKDVGEINGPLQWIPGTQKIRFKFLEILKGNYLKLTDFLGGNRRYQLLPDELIESYLNRGFHIKECCVEGGSAVLINSSCVHRAKPCSKEDRYALCSYFH